jgi:hypothetical protein
MEFFNNDGGRTGLFFGATSGVITTIGLIAGLHAGTGSLAAVLGGILVIAVADAMSDALGIHLAEEADPNATPQHIWAATISTFIAKFVFAITFAIPVLLLPLWPAVLASVAWGIFNRRTRTDRHHCCGRVALHRRLGQRRICLITKE